MIDEIGPAVPHEGDGGPNSLAGPGSQTQRVRLDIAYDGTDFSGWAAQPGRRTVAGVLLGELERIFGPSGVTGLTVAGRTDAGVHATGQVAHIDVAHTAWVQLQPSLIRRLAGMLPSDVRVMNATAAPPQFDARFSALSRRYIYRVATDAFGAMPLRARDTLSWPRHLDVDAMNVASAALVGHHDFAAFCRRRQNATTVRAIARFDWHRDHDGILVATVEADAFCWSMVRSLVGAVLAVGEGRRTAAWPHGLLNRTERANDVLVAPAHGLTLVAVAYPKSAEEYASRALLTRNVRALPAEDSGA